ncbi:Aste57867_8007 [Aphanomyces stellatus]|uniref:Aste57867_8007 protein n=1 Tax=Aphanomyces stellatus TaxID=120398 RepID=A0A485KJ64_9STRA|nr:hypothetical protein As57867_007977 [Aphanomyces stellatus]VFT84900.1 Aste57867_8007 [Aphanomyces stellatus]
MNMVRLVNEFKFSQQQLETLERNLLEKGCEKNTLEAQIKQLRVAYSDMERKANTSQHELKEQTEKLTVAQNQVLKQRSQVHSLQNDLKSSKAECEEIEGKLSEQQQTHAKSLEKAMQSLVRLCVVAPTVNVHLSGQVLPCKSVLPKDAIRTIVQKDILPVFSSIFLQDEEGTSPTGS